VTYIREFSDFPKFTQEIYRKYNRDGTPKGEEVIFAEEIISFGAKCATFGDDTFVVASEISKNIYFFNSRDELFRTIEMDRVATFATSPNGKILVNVESYHIYLFNSNGDLIGFLVDYTEGQYGGNPDIVFLDDETLYVSWDLRYDPENSNARDIYGRFIKFYEVN